MKLEHWKSTEQRVSEDEQALVARAVAGDRTAFDRLVHLHYSRVYGVAFRLLGNHEDAEDIAQESFVRAHGGLKWFRCEGTFAGWLRRIVLHLVRDRYRRDGRRPGHESIVVETPARAAHEPERQLGQKELTRRLRDAMEALPARLRMALILRTREELSYEEIAAATGVTPATARTQVMKARRALQRWFPGDPSAGADQ